MKNRKPMLSPEAVAFVAGDPQATAPSPAPRSSLKEEKPVRFTVDMPEALHRRLKVAAMDRRQPMTEAAREAITQWLDSLPY